ncbi:TPA: hypothetical protein ACH3X2_004438 [Trebouxia sp. C0005]
MSAPAWKGLFDWSMQHQSSEGAPPKQVTPEEQKWFQEAMAQYTVDHVGRMKQIKATLDQPDETADAVHKKQDMLEELLDIVDNIDYARDLHTIGGLPTLLSLLQGSHASIRWRAAEVVATCVQNNPPVQQWFMEGGAMPKLLHLLHDEDASCRTKALLALSCLIRLNPLALEVFRQKRGIPQLIQAADDQDIKVQRKALHLLRHVVHAHPPDAMVACQLGALHQAAFHLASSDTDTWQAALALVQQLAEDSQSAQILQQDKQLQHQLQTLQAKLQGLTGEDKEATEEELAVCKQLMHSLYNTSSQSGSMPQTEPSRRQASATAAANGANRLQLPQAQSPGHSNSSLPAAPLLLGPPSQS